MIAVATIEAELEELRRQLRGFGARVTDVLSPDDTRRVALVVAPEARAGEPTAALLREAGWMAVTRPAGGAALRAWHHDTRPVTVADRVTVCSAWSEHDRRGRPGLIELGSGGFGNGHHPTTRLALETLAERIGGGERVLDVGCGSGVLALGALVFGAAAAVAVDIKPEAAAAASRNAELNGVADRLEVQRGPLEDVDGPFDVVVANIARAGAVALAPELTAHTAPGGWLAVSGLTPAQCGPVAEFLGPLAETERRIVGEWAVLVLARP